MYSTNIYVFYEKTDLRLRATEQSSFKIHVHNSVVIPTNTQICRCLKKLFKSSLAVFSKFFSDPRL